MRNVINPLVVEIRNDICSKFDEDMFLKLWRIQNYYSSQRHNEYFKDPYLCHFFSIFARSDYFKSLVMIKSDVKANIKEKNITEEQYLRDKHKLLGKRMQSMNSEAQAGLSS